jgi:hypothetical protein
MGFIDLNFLNADFVWTESWVHNHVQHKPNWLNDYPTLVLLHS